MKDTLSLIAWAGYTEDSWVKPFEQDTGCKVDVKYGNDSADMVNLMPQGGGTLYDGVSASGDASNRLIAGGDVAPIDISMFPDYADVMPSLQSPGAQHGGRRRTTAFRTCGDRTSSCTTPTS